MERKKHLSMILKKQVKAGILLYALLMLSMFSLLLQFYLNRQKTEIVLLKAHQEATQAYMMARATQQEVTNMLQREVDGQRKQKNSEGTEENSLNNSLHTNGQVSFIQGTANYQLVNEKMLMTIQMMSGHVYRYQWIVSLNRE